MPHSFDALYVHVVFGTRGREPWLAAEWRSDLWGQIGRVAKTRGQTPMIVGGIADHVHVLASLTRTVAPCDFVREIKAASSQWIRRYRALPDFAWQNGYGVFSVSKSNASVVADYIARQEEHHRGMTFEDEYRALLERHGLAYDERDLLG